MRNMKDDMPQDNNISLLSLQNPQNVAPDHIIEAQQILSVSYYGFDDLIRGGFIVMHKDVARDVLDFFSLALKLRFPIERVVPISDDKYCWNDELSMADNNTSGFNYRMIMGTNILSNHATGRAFDVNPKQNIYVKYDEKGKEIFCYPPGASYYEQVKGTLTRDHLLVEFLKKRGWVWGGDWNRGDGVLDYQHFEKL